MGNGESFCFKEDVWVADSSFLFPHVHHLVCFHNGSITPKVSSHPAPMSWNFNLFKKNWDRETVELVFWFAIFDESP